MSASSDSASLIVLPFFPHSIRYGTMKPTPDSVPSLAEVSTESGDDDVDAITRVLFESPESIPGKAPEIVEVEHVSVKVSSDNSIAASSSEGSDESVATLGISASPNMEVVQAALEEITHSPDVFKDQSANMCHGGFGSRDLADIFTMFNGAQKHWPASPPAPPAHPPFPSPPVSVADSGAITTVTSNLQCGNVTSWERKIDSLERECSTLKDIIKADSLTILKLKSQIEVLHRRNNLSKESSLKAEIEMLRREREGLRQRDGQHVETIRILKEELNTLSKLHYASSLTHHQMDQLRLENDLFAAQIVENESEIRQLRLELEETEKQAVYFEQVALETPPQTPSPYHLPAEGKPAELKYEEESITEPESPETEGGSNTLEQKDRDSVLTKSPLETQLALLTARLDALEHERHQPVRNPPYRPEAPSDEVSQNGGFEVSMDGKVVGDAPQNGVKKESDENLGWSGLCDCLLHSHSID